MVADLGKNPAELFRGGQVLGFRVAGHELPGIIEGGGKAVSIVELPMVIVKLER